LRGPRYVRSRSHPFARKTHRRDSNKVEKVWHDERWLVAWARGGVYLVRSGLYALSPTEPERAPKCTMVGTG